MAVKSEGCFYVEEPAAVGAARMGLRVSGSKTNEICCLMYSTVILNTVVHRNNNVKNYYQNFCKLCSSFFYCFGECLLYNGTMQVVLIDV